VATLRTWWKSVGQARYPRAGRLLVCADSGGSNGSRIRAWKIELAKLAKETGLDITVCHLPPGTSKWNKIEHRLFSQITRNWAGQPLRTHQIIVDLIGKTTTATGWFQALRTKRRNSADAPKSAQRGLIAGLD